MSDDGEISRLRLATSVYHRPMAHPQIPYDVLRVTEPELREKLSTPLDRVAYAEEELVVMRDGKPIAAVVRMDGLRALRHVAPINVQGGLRESDGNCCGR